MDRIAFNIHSIVLVADPLETTSAAAAAKIRRDYLVAVAELNRLVEPRTKAKKGELAGLMVAWVRTRSKVCCMHISEYAT